MADQNFRVKHGLEVGIGGTILIAKSDGNIGIGSAIPTTKLDVDGTVTATSFDGDITGNLTGTATTATNLANGANITTGTISDDRLPDLITSNVNIASGISSVATLDATNATIDNLTFTSGTAITSIDTDLSSVSSSDDTLASAKAIKTYIDTEVTAQDLDFQADTGGALSIDLDSETLSVVGTSNEIETAGSGNQIQIGLPNEVEITTSLVVGSATTINAAGIIAGIVTATSFVGDGSYLTGISTVTELSSDTSPQLGGDLDLNSNDITGTGNVNITGVITATSFDGNLATTDLTGTITNAQLAGSIANDKLSNSSVSFGGVSVSLGAADATPAFDLQDATGYPTSSLTGTITNDQLAGSIADGKLASTFLKHVVEDTSPQLGGTLDTNGNLIQFGDSDSATDDRLKFGASQDLQIYHKTDSYIRDTGAGSLILTGSRIILKNPANDERMIDASENGSVKLLHNNLEKLETTGIGVSIVNGTETTATIAGPANLVLDPAAVGDNTGVVRIKGDLFVDGTQTQINSTTLELADFVVGVATTATTDLLTDGAGIGIGSDKTFLYEHNSGTNPSLKSSENLNVASGKGYQINQTEVLNATTLGSNVVSSSLTSVGTLSALTVSGRVDVGGLTVDSNLTPTAGASIEAFYNSGGFIQAYDRDAPGFTSLRIKSSNYELGSDGSATFGSSTNDQLILNPGSGNLDGDASKVTVQGRTNDGTAVAFEIKRQASANSSDASTHKLKIDYAGNFGIGSDFVPAGANGATLGAVNKGMIIKGGDAAVGMRLESTAGSGGILEAFAEDGGVSFDTRGSGFIRVKSASSEALRITSSGSVGIGSEIPTTKLDVDGTVTAIGFSVTSDTTNPVMSIKGAGPNFIRFFDAPGMTETSNGIDLVYRTGANTLGFEKSTDGSNLWQTNVMNGVTNFNYTPTVSGTNILTVDGTAALANNLTGTPDIIVGVATATKFVKSSNSGGFLKADGTEDTSTYLTSVGTSDISDNAVTHAKYQEVATDTIIGRTASGNGIVTALTAAEVRGIINVADGATNVTDNNQLTNGAGYITSTYSGTLTINSSTSLALKLNHNDFAEAIEIHREHATNAAAIKFSNNTAQLGILFATSSEDVKWRDGTSSNSYTIWHEGNLTNNNQLTNGAGYITSSGTAALAQGLTGSPDISVNTATITGGQINVGANSNNLLGEVTIFKGDDFSTASQPGINDNIYLASDATSGNNVYGASIAFSRVQYQDRRAAAIAAVQTSSDEDQVGLAFFTHPSTDATQPIVEKLRIKHDGTVNIGSQTNPIDIKHYTTNSGTLSFEASAGQLFSITNELSSGSIFSVNDISGIPSIDVNADGTVQLAPFGGVVELYQGGTKRLETTSSGITVTGNIVKSGGTSSQFLKANGSVDSSTYLTSFDITTQTDSKYLRSNADDISTGRIEFQANATNNWDTIASTSGGLGSIEVRNDGAGNDAFMAFHASSDYAIYFGLDADANELAVGGWSMGANKYKIWHAGNLTNNNQLTNGAGYITSSGTAALANNLTGTPNITVGTITATSLSVSSTGNPITTNAIKFNNTENDTNYYTESSGILAFDENFPTDTNYGTGNYTPHGAFVNIASSGTDENGGGLIVKNEDGWGALISTQNMKWLHFRPHEVTASGNVTAFSDITLKKNIESIPNALDKVLNLRGVTYNRIDINNEPRHSGVIAQEVEEVLPEVVNTDEETGIKSVAYGNMVGLLIEAIKEQQQEINNLKEMIRNLS